MTQAAEAGTTQWLGLGLVLLLSVVGVLADIALKRANEAATPFSSRYFILGSGFYALTGFA